MRITKKTSSLQTSVRTLCLCLQSQLLEGRRHFEPCLLDTKRTLLSRRQVKVYTCSTSLPGWWLLQKRVFLSRSVCAEGESIFFRDITKCDKENNMTEKEKNSFLWLTILFVKATFVFPFFFFMSVEIAFVSLCKYFYSRKKRLLFFFLCIK